MSIGVRMFDPMENFRLHVLVVEDDECTRDALVDFLSDEGFTVESALDGQEALGVAAAGDLDVIVLDLGLPVLDGMAFADIWRRHSSRAHVPIVATSALPQGEALAAEFGAVAFRSKPLDFGALADLLRTTAGQSGHEGSATRLLTSHPPPNCGDGLHP
jgi:DNA-binding response OmpR family regulator